MMKVGLLDDAAGAQRWTEGTNGRGTKMGWAEHKDGLDNERYLRWVSENSGTNHKDGRGTKMGGTQRWAGY